LLDLSGLFPAKGEKDHFYIHALHFPFRFGWDVPGCSGRPILSLHAGEQIHQEYFSTKQYYIIENSEREPSGNSLEKQ